MTPRPLHQQPRREGQWLTVGLAAQKNKTSIHVNADDPDGYLVKSTPAGSAK